MRIGFPFSLIEPLTLIQGQRHPCVSEPNRQSDGRYRRYFGIVVKSFGTDFLVKPGQVNLHSASLDMKTEERKNVSRLEECQKKLR